KQDPATRHIPVQILTLEEERQHGLEHGAFSYLTKPLSAEALEAALARLQQYTRPRVKQLMIVEDDETERNSMVELLACKDVEITTASGGREAWQLIRARAFDCMVLDLRLPDTSGFDLLGKIQAEPALHSLPIAVFTGNDLSVEEELRLREMARSLIIKRVQSP